jgi:hypothetical protein
MALANHCRGHDNATDDKGGDLVFVRNPKASKHVKVKVYRDVVVSCIILISLSVS